MDERVAILRRFRSLLEQQRNKFREYLFSLERQQDLISENQTDALIAHTELEQQVVANIASLQKVIVPMAELYKSRSAALASSEEDASVQKLQHELSQLQEKVLLQNEKNRRLLRMSINLVKEQLAQIKNPFHNTHSVYAVRQPVATLVEVEA